MHIDLPRPQRMLTKEEEEKEYWDLLKYNSHKWVEFAVGYYQCEYCKKDILKSCKSNHEKSKIHNLYYNFTTKVHE